MRIILKIGLPILIAVIFVFLPFFANPDLLLTRNNDLTEFFWPIFYYVKQNILINHTIPTTNEMWFAGTPLLPDPQNPVWYLPNIIFLVFPIDTAIMISSFIHSLLGTFGMYLVARRVFNFKKNVSLIIASIFILSPVYFSFLEAGHWGLAIAWNWLPYFLLSAYFLWAKPNWKTALLFAASASSLYFNHLLTALIVAIPVGLFWIYKRSVRFPLLACILAFIVVFPIFYQQISWQGKTTRSLLLANPETFPIWRGKREALKTLFIFNPETEKAITFGVLPSALALFGFWQLKNRQKLFLFVVLIVLALLVLNNISPLLPILLNTKPFVLMRVATRVWPVAFFTLLFVFGKGLSKLSPKIGLLLGVLAVAESAVISYSYIAKPISARETVPNGVYEILAHDKDNFRVFCLTRCIPQKEAAIRGFKLVEGYGTLQEKDYFEKMQLILNQKWDKYTLSVPPFQTYLSDKPQPNAKILSELNTKYVISKYELNDRNFLLLEKIESSYVYKDLYWRN